MAIWYHFFCDESGIHNRPDYWIGGIKLTPNRERRLRSEITEFLSNRGIAHELKWNKVNRTYLSAYKELTSIFMDSDSAQYKALHVIKGKYWNSFGSNEEERFFKSYYVYFRKYASHNHRHNLILDYKTSKWYRWNQLSYALNGKATQNLQSGRHISTVTPKDSKSDILLQLADVLLGTIAYSGDGNSAKGELSDYVRTYLFHKTKYGSQLFTIHEFTPTKRG